MNPIFLTARTSPPLETEEAILHHWHSGGRFKIYEHDEPVTKEAVVKMRMAKFTHIIFIWQDKDLQVKSHTMELK